MAATVAGAAASTGTGRRFGFELAVATIAPLALVLLAAGPLQERVLWLIGITAAPHVMAGFAFYFDRDARPVLASDARRFYLAPVMLVAGFAAFGSVAGSLDPRVPATAIGAFFVWQFHHFSRQNYGVMSLVLRAWGLDRLSDREARLIRWGGLASMPGGLRPVRLLFGAMLVPDVVIDACFVAGLVLLTAALFEVVTSGARGRRLAMLAGVTVFHLPLFVVPTAATALALHAVAHPFQYGYIMWRLRDGRDTGKARTTMVLLVLATGGAWVLRTITAGDTPLVGVLVGAGFGIVAWHFVLDAGVWKLSKPEPRAYMKRRFAFL